MRVHWLIHVPDSHLSGSHLPAPNDTLPSATVAHWVKHTLLWSEYLCPPYPRGEGGGGGFGRW